LFFCQQSALREHLQKGTGRELNGHETLSQELC